MTFANKTDVPVSRSQDEIRRTLERYNATGFMFGQHNGQSAVAFEIKARRVKFVVDTPTYGKTKNKRNHLMSQKECEQLNRSRWRCLLLAIKAKLECVESGMATFEEEFMAYIVLPNGATIGQLMVPQITETYQTGVMPPLLGGRV